VPLNTLQRLLELAGPEPELAVLQEEVEQERDKKGMACIKEDPLSGSTTVSSDNGD
jgi:hypothetical protein